MSDDMDVDPQRVQFHKQVLRLAGLEVVDSDISSRLRALLERCSLELPQNIKNRLEPYLWIETNQQQIDACVLENSFENLQVLDKNSASDSWIMFATLFEMPVAIKLTAFPRISEAVLNYYTLETERFIYENVVNSLLICGYTPHVLAYYATLNCDTFLSSSARRQNAQTLKLIQNFQSERFSERYDNQKMRASVVERAQGGITMMEFFDQNQTSFDSLFPTILLPMLFQVFYTLAVFAEIGLMHNDLHLGNVFIEQLPELETNYYRVGNKTFAVKSRHQVRLFDFDRSVKIPTSFDSSSLQNTGLYFHCRKFGQCNELNQRAELFPFVAFLFENNTTLQNTELQDFITQIVPEDLLDRLTHDEKMFEEVIPTIPGTTLAYRGRLCVCNDIDCSTCTIFNDQRIKTPKQILEMDEFRDFISTAPPQNTFVWTLPSQRQLVLAN